MTGRSRRGIHSFRKRLRTPARVPIQPHEGERTLAQIETQSRDLHNRLAGQFGLLAYLAFVGVTLMGVEDADFFVSTRQIQLPLVGVSIPTLTFFWTAPLLGAVLYVYLHLHLMSLWHALARAPTEIDGKPLGERGDPWPVNDLALRTRRDKPFRTQPLRWLANLVTIALVWLAGPVVLVGFWLRSMPAHELGMTLLISLCVLVSLFVGVSSAVTFRQVIPLEKEHARPWRPMWRKALAGLVAVVVLFYGAAWSQFGFPTDPRVNAAFDTMEAWTGPRFEDEVANDGSVAQSARDAQTAWLETWIRRLGAELSSADLTEVELVPKPSDWRSRVVAQRRFRAEWCAQQDVPRSVCSETGVEDAIDRTSLNAQRVAWCDTAPHIPHMPGFEATEAPKVLRCARFFAQQDEGFLEAWNEERQSQLDALSPLDLRGRDLRIAKANGAFLANADLLGAHLEGAGLRRASLEGATLQFAHLKRAALQFSHLEAADLGGAHLEGADLLRAKLQGAVLWGAHLESTNLRGSQLYGADLRFAHLKRAVLRLAHLKRADLGGAHLEGADLRSVHLGSANLRHAHLEDADLRFAHLEDANLKDARLKGASLQGATLAHALIHGADITGSLGLTQNQLNTVLGSDDTKLPADANTGRPLHVWSCWAELPPHWDDLLEHFSFGNPIRVETLRADLLCSPGTEPECRGTYVSPDGVVGEPGSSCPDRSP